MSDDRAALEQLLSTSNSAVPHVVLHYLYFPSKSEGFQAAAELRSRGFRTEQRLGADGSNWLVLARHEIVPTEEAIELARGTMEAVTQNGGGEYDGWEAEVQQ